MLVLHEEHLPDTFMACVGHGPTFYRAWLGGDSYGDISAVRVFHNDIDRIRFSPHIFSRVTGTELPLRRVAVVPPSHSTSPATRGRREDEDGDEDANRPWRKDLFKSDASGTSQLEPDRMLPSSSGLATNSRREFGSNNGNNESEGHGREIPTPAETAIVFKLVSRERQITRCFPLEECRCVRDFFRKSDEFFSLIGTSITTRSLSCRIPDGKEERYLYENQGEFDVLIQDARDHYRIHGGCRVVIEVTCVS
ncbi:hypothetical protein VTN02DRAFT_2407 [Thermoascus thermophilus]